MTAQDLGNILIYLVKNGIPGICNVYFSQNRHAGVIRKVVQAGT